MSLEDFINIEPVANKKELDLLVDKYLKLINSEDKVQREINKTKASEIRKRIVEGIPIKNWILIDKIIELITSFLKKNNYDYEKFRKMIEKTKFSIVDFRIFINQKGLACSVGKDISFNASICEFDNDGNFKGVKSENIELLTHIIFHELFHRISAFRDDKEEINAKDTALSEGFTDFFAEMLSGYNGTNKSKNYQFSKDVCNIFYIMLGSEKVIDDYINHLMEYPNLKELFKEYGLDFNKFVKLFDKALNMRYKNDNIDKIIELENEILLMLKDKLFIPFINNHPEKSEIIMNTFNLLFQERELNISEKKK